MTAFFEERVEHPSDIIGNWGPFQSRTFVFVFLIYFVSPLQNRAIIFYAPRIDFWCKRPPGFENATLQTCSSYEGPETKCTEWEYDNSFHYSTMIDQFDLVCDRDWWVSVAQSSFQVGYLISSILVGYISDRFGRLTALKLCVVLSVFSGVGETFAPNMYLFVFARMFCGIAAYGRFMSGYVLLVEYVGSRHRSKLGPCIEFSSAISEMIQPVIYYWIRDFHNMQYVVIGYEVLVSVGLLLMSESPRWLLANGHYNRAREIILKAAKEKGKLSTEEIEAKLDRLKSFVNSEAESSKKKQTLLDIYKDPTLRKNCFLLYGVWFACAFVFYGIMLNIGDLGGDLFVNIFVTSVGCFIVQVILLFIVERIPRRHMLCIFCFLSAGSLFAMASVTNAAPIYMTVLAFIGFSNLIVVYIINYIYAAEIFPTTVRQIAMGSCGFVSQIGAILAPFMRELTEFTHLSVSLCVLGIMACISGFLVIFLPETRGEEIPDTIKQTKRRPSQVSTNC